MVPPLLPSILPAFLSEPGSTDGGDRPPLLLPPDPEIRPRIERAAMGARANGTPFLSYFTPDEMLSLARESGFETVRHISADALAARYFADRTDGLRPPSNSEELLVART